MSRESGESPEAEPLIREMSGGTGLVTNAEPTPAFRRFPWIQLVFCLACLSMTAWTWMRYSYAWEITSKDELQPVGIHGLLRCPGPECPEITSHSLRERYVRIHPEVYGSPDLAVSVFVDSGYAKGDQAETGRAYVIGPIPEYGLGRHEYVIDTTVSRFHQASIAGLVVGAMGCFIFGLYLRGWLRERKALASEPPQDMIV